MRYLITTNASRPIVAVGRSFEKMGAGNRATRAITGSRKPAATNLLDDTDAVG